MGCVGYDQQHTECQQLDLMWIQTVHPEGSVLVRKSVVLEEKTLGGIVFKDPVVRKAKQKLYSKRYYEKNRKSIIKKAKTTKDKAKDKWIAYKEKQRCSYCRKKHPAIIDFHHVIKEDKRSVNYLAVKQSNVQEAIKEAEEKCIPLCANCHRILHWDLTRTEMRKRRKKWR